MSNEKKILKKFKTVEFDEKTVNIEQIGQSSIRESSDQTNNANNYYENLKDQILKENSQIIEPSLKKPRKSSPVKQLDLMSLGDHKFDASMADIHASPDIIKDYKA